MNGKKVKAEFPILTKPVRNKELVYLDNAATTQKPQRVIQAVQRYYEEENSNVHRGVHYLSEKATFEFESARKKVQQFIHAAYSHEIVFVRGTTEAVNLVAQTFGRAHLKAGDEVLITTMEHHSNIVPWQMLCQQTGVVLKVAPITDAGELDLEAFDRLLGPKTKLVSVVHVSNALGTVNPIREIIQRSHERGIPVLVDGAQALPHQRVDVQALDCDFYTFSGHKMYGPTGIGVLYGKSRWLEAMPPWQGGGDMILKVTFEKTVYNQLPYKFEAGTPNIAGAIGLGAAVDFLQELGMEKVWAHEKALLEYGTEKLKHIPGLRMVGTAKEKAGVLSFVLEDIHAHDVGTILDQEGIAIRSGHHCAQPLMDRFGLSATARASLGVYNSTEDLDALARGLLRVREVFQ